MTNSAAAVSTDVMSHLATHGLSSRLLLGIVQQAPDDVQNGALAVCVHQLLQQAKQDRHSRLKSPGHAKPHQMIYAPGHCPEALRIQWLFDLWATSVHGCLDCLQLLAAQNSWTAARPSLCMASAMCSLNSHMTWRWLSICMCMLTCMLASHTHA